MLAGRVAGISAHGKKIDATTTEVEIEVRLIDPLNRIKEVSLHHQNARDLKEKPKQDRDTRLDPHGRRTMARLTLDGQKAKGKVRLTRRTSALCSSSSRSPASRARARAHHGDDHP